MQKPDPRFLAAWRAFLEAHVTITRQLNDELQEAAGFPLAWYDLLVQLNEAGGVLRMHQLADSLLISRSATTRFVDRIENRGFIRREICDEDRRGMNVVLTDQGLDALRRAAPMHLDGVARLFTSRLTHTEAVDLLGVFSRLMSD
ncbi:MAG: MarR family transcriptional regulator [Acidimicrobiia bacterium]|nr:MarR family transcriptional regulator [Acidimicrobiia bacterium]